MVLGLMVLMNQMVFGIAIQGNPEGIAPIPPAARLEDVSTPDHVIGTGTPESCTSQAFIEAVAQGGVIVFDGGDQPFTLVLDEQAVVYNDGMPEVIIDGGGLVTLSGGGNNRLLYMNTCDERLTWTSSHCQNQEYPKLTVQNLHFTEGNSIKDTSYTGGGAIWVRGGRFKAINCVFTKNQCAETGPDVGGGAIRVFSQYQGLPVYLVNCTFGGGEGLGNQGANGGAISSIGVSWTIINSIFSYNKALGNGGNPAQPGTFGGGSGGAIYNDGNEMTLTLIDSRIDHNEVNAHGSGIFFVTNNHTGSIELYDSVIQDNQGGSWYPTMANISGHSDTPIRSNNGPTNAITQGNASPTASIVYVNNVPVDFQSYFIGDNNYFKLRDLAMILRGSEQSFEVDWHETSRQITLTSQKDYTPVGGEFNHSMEGQQPYNQMIQEIEVDAMTLRMNSYLIGGNNYFKLRDIATIVDFGVTWDSTSNNIHINTKESYQRP